MNRKNKRKPDGEKIFSIVASFAIIAALVVGVYSIVKSTSTDDNNYIDLNLSEKETTLEDETSRVQKAEVETEKKTEEVTEAPEATTPALDEAAVTQTEEVPQEVNAPVFSFGESSSLLWPVDGDIILGYNMDSTIYFPTLDQYKCNPAIIISADTGTQVLSGAQGMVENIYNDAVTGTTLVISIGNGYKLTYGQLTDVAVAISDVVEAGTVLGTVAEPSRYFELEGSNVYFKLTHDDAPVDPLLHLIEE